jgi:hypothetical protein
VEGWGMKQFALSFFLLVTTTTALQQVPPSTSSRRAAFHRILGTTTVCGVAAAGLLIPTDPVNADSLLGGGVGGEETGVGGSSVVVPGGVAPYRPQGIGSWKDIPTLTTKLAKSRILASELSPLQQAFLCDKELYYAPFLFGSWNVKAQLKRKIYPYGINYLPSTSLLEGSPRNREELVGNVCEYEVHYFSTGSSGTDGKIIQDRGFNAKSLSKAYDQLVPVEEVTWDYRNNPEKVLLEFGAAPLTADMRPLGPRRAEVFFNARTSEATSDGQTFATAERSRSVTIASRDVVVADTETITEFQRLSEDSVRGISRIAVYLSPNPNSREGVLWQQTNGKAVAFFDYELDMNRIRQNNSQACVVTPKSETPCI